MPGQMPMPQRSSGQAGARLRRMSLHLLTQEYLTSSTNTGGAATDLGGGDGSWTNPTNAQGADNATYAVWTVPVL